MNRFAFALAFAAAVGLSAVAAAANDAHGGHDARHSEPTLNHGKKWPTDGALRHGMSEIRRLVADALPKVHRGGLDAGAVSQKIMAHVDYVTANCKLPEDADAQLHIVLAGIIDGAEQMTAADSAADGMATVAGAIEAYGRTFDHPGWLPLAH